MVVELTDVPPDASLVVVVDVLLPEEEVSLDAALEAPSLLLEPTPVVVGALELPDVPAGCSGALLLAAGSDGDGEPSGVEEPV